MKTFGGDRSTVFRTIRPFEGNPTESFFAKRER
jgi:hypothetical protein